jgi:WD40 repeat protein
MKRVAFVLSVAALAVLWPARHAVVTAQTPLAPDCRPPAPAASRAPIIFNEEQENDLGDAIDEHVGREFRVIDDDEVTAYLRRIGDRLVKHLPPTKLHFQFFMIDLPEANAMEMPGGRIYVSRKLVALTKDEDELAAVIAHEAGHLIARQQAAFVTKLFKDVLNVTSVSDRADIFDKYNRLMDNAAKHPNAFRNHEDTEQIEADQMGVFAVAAAGYDPQAHARFMDRLLGTKGDTGGFFSNLFGTTSRDAVRLRELLRNTKAVPAACIDPRAADAPAFERWRSSVVAFTGLAAKESVPGVVTRTRLEPPLSGEIVSVRFTPDGTRLLAQDDGGISVLSREPFQVLFHIDAWDVAAAAFTPDSKSLVFHTTDHRVERWDLASRRMVEVHEVYLNKLCLQTALSPDGHTLACLEPAADYLRLTLSLVDVATAETTLQFKELTSATPANLAALSMWGASRLVDSGYRFVEMGFSPDGRFLVAGKERGGLVGTSAGEDVLVYDLQAKQAVPIKGEAKKFIAGGFVFTASDQLATFNRVAPKESAVIHLPDGAVSERVLMFDGSYEPATKGAFVFIRPFQKYSVGVLDMTKHVVVKGLPNGAIDIYGDAFVAERGTGELGLYGMDNQVRASVTLPRASLSRVRAAAISDDFKYVAVSSRSRGMLWDAVKGQSMTQTREFAGATFAQDDLFIADFPRAKDEPHLLMRIDPGQRAAPSSTPIASTSSNQIGPYLVVRSPAKPEGDMREGQTIEVRDVATGGSLWKKTFAMEPPAQWLSSRAPEAMVLAWSMTSKTARDEVRKDAALARKPAALKPLDSDYFLRVIDMRSGSIRGQMVFETGSGSFDLSSALVVGDILTLGDSENRVRLYSLKTGDSFGRVFGSRAIVSPTGQLFAVENGPGHLTLYDVATLKKRESYVFSHSVTLSRFSPDGARLFVLTSDQATYVIDVPK